MTSHITITPAGIEVPQASEIKTAFQDILKDAFGSDINLDDSTSQGVWVGDLTEEKMVDNSAVLYLFNQFNPTTASGVFQDALASIFGLTRKIATHSIVNCECIGLEGTVLNGIASGNPAMAISANGDKFECVEGGTIDSTGTITLQFRSVETGQIPCDANTVNGIFGTVIGWDSVNNSVAGTVGEEAESQFDFAERIKKSLALNSTGSLSSVYSKVFALNDVTDVLVWENDTSSSVTVRGITLTPHSIYICQQGASIINGNNGSGSLAEAIYSSKSAGCDTVGTYTCTYTDDVTDVAYSYKYDTPTESAVYIKVILTNATSLASQAEMADAIIKDFNGDLNKSKITIGESVYASRFLSVVAGLELDDVDLEGLQVSKDGVTYTNVLTYNMNILPTIEEANITFEVSV